MLEIIDIADNKTTPDTLATLVTRVCHRVPPLWDLQNYVAVNPFLGFASRPIDESIREIGDGLGAQVLPSVDYYCGRWKDGTIGMFDLAQAAARSGQRADTLEAVLAGQAVAPRRRFDGVLTFAEKHDQRHGTKWNEAVLRQIARWCAVYQSGGGTHWSHSTDRPTLYISWCEAAAADRSLELAGLSGWRAWALQLPDRPTQAIELMLKQLQVSAQQQERYLYRLLGGVYGWASFLRGVAWQRGGNVSETLADLLAIRICADAAVAQLAPASTRARSRSSTSIASPSPIIEDESLRLVFQDALEDAFVHRLLKKIAPPTPASTSQRRAVQAVFCIDVRSEPLRRHLEAQDEHIQTIGFAGFFGVSLDWQFQGVGSARCPVLLKPAMRVKSRASAPSVAVGSTAKHLQVSPPAAFSFVELLGVGYSFGLARDALANSPAARSSEGTAPFDLKPDGSGHGIVEQARLDLACGILKNMGLHTSFARLILLCGHAGHSVNNPHAASLDCGACGGHGGAINARIAAAILNDPSVRQGLPGRGWDVPADTHFLAGVHDTSVDEVTLLDQDKLPASHRPDLVRLQEWLAQAGAMVRTERAIALGLSEVPPESLSKVMDRRARDCSEVRPEWGLARNAAFIAAKRDRTRGVNLQGRAFLHDYDCTNDTDNSVLTLILSAPMVVASWINLQYFASTVDNRVFGCGTKTLHNRVGSLGVVLGNGGDLRTGLAIQSVHASDGSWYHEPLRLQVIVEAPTTQIDAVLNAQPSVKELVDNGWVRLFALDPQTAASSRWLPGHGWQDDQSIHVVGNTISTAPQASA